MRSVASSFRRIKKSNMVALSRLAFSLQIRTLHVSLILVILVCVLNTSSHIAVFAFRYPRGRVKSPASPMTQHAGLVIVLWRREEQFFEVATTNLWEGTLVCNW